jgi:hypothetical protein
MTNARLTIDEAKGFLAANPLVQWIDASVFDMNGIPRGKRIRRSDLRRRWAAYGRPAIRITIATFSLGRWSRSPSAMAGTRKS